MKNIFEGSLTKEVTVLGKTVFEEGFKFSASEAGKKFDSTASAVQIYEDQSASPSIQYYPKLEGK